MPTKPTAPSWTCDECGEPIASPEDGWVEWLVYGEYPGKGLGLRLVHRWPASPRHENGGCGYILKFSEKTGHIRPRVGHVYDMHMDYFMGPMGLLRLLEILERGHATQAEALEMVRRLHVPGFEADDTRVPRGDMLRRVAQEERAVCHEVVDRKPDESATDYLDQVAPRLDQLYGIKELERHFKGGEEQS